jgi:hypothetical protein
MDGKWKTCLKASLVAGTGETGEKLKASWGIKRNTREKQSKFMTSSTIGRPSNNITPQNLIF